MEPFFASFAPLRDKMNYGYADGFQPWEQPMDFQSKDIEFILDACAALLLTKNLFSVPSVVKSFSFLDQHCSY